MLSKRMDLCAIMIIIVNFTIIMGSRHTALQDQVDILAAQCFFLECEEDATPKPQWARTSFDGKPALATVQFALKCLTQKLGVHYHPRCVNHHPPPCFFLPQPSSRARTHTVSGLPILARSFSFWFLAS